MSRSSSQLTWRKASITTRTSWSVTWGPRKIEDLVGCSPVHPIAPGTDQRRQKGHLGEEPVARLLENDRARPVDDLVGDLLATMGRQAVEEDSVGGRLQQAAVDLVAGELELPRLPFGLLSHRG